jgi:hypothetical protein
VRVFRKRFKYKLLTSADVTRRVSVRPDYPMQPTRCVNREVPAGVRVKVRFWQQPMQPTRGVDREVPAVLGLRLRFDFGSNPCNPPDVWTERCMQC